MYRRPFIKRREKRVAAAAIALLLHQDIQNEAMLIRGSSQVMQHSSDTEGHLVEVPDIAGTGLDPTTGRPLSPLTHWSNGQARDRSAD